MMIRLNEKNALNKNEYCGRFVGCSLERYIRNIVCRMSKYIYYNFSYVAFKCIVRYDAYSLFYYAVR